MSDAPGPATRKGITRHHGCVPRSAALLLAALTLALLGASVALATELVQEPERAPEPQPTSTAAPVVQATPDPTPTPEPEPAEPAADAPLTETPVRWRRSRAVGKPFAGRLVRGVKLPASGRDFFTWDPILKAVPNRPWRRHATDGLIRTLLEVLAEHRAAFPDAPRVGIGDLSRPRGGVFDKRFGGLGHASHQNGLDVDLYYPRLDGAERRAHRPAQVDQVLAQDLVDRFVAQGAQYVFVGPRLSLTGPRRVVQKLRHHDDHLHLRIRPPAR